LSIGALLGTNWCGWLLGKLQCSTERRKMNIIKRLTRRHREIPIGHYCHGKRMDNVCPHWLKIPGRPAQADGFCAFLVEGDLEINEELGRMGLLFDKMKECDINI